MQDTASITSIFQKLAELLAREGLQDDKGAMAILSKLQPASTKPTPFEAGVARAAQAVRRARAELDKAIDEIDMHEQSVIQAKQRGAEKARKLEEAEELQRQEALAVGKAAGQQEAQGQEGR